MGDSPATEARTSTGTGGCCGTAPQSTLTLPDLPVAAASPCCGTTADAAAEGACCGGTAEAEAVAAGQGCCG